MASLTWQKYLISNFPHIAAISLYCLWIRGFPQELCSSRDCQKGVACCVNKENTQCEWGIIKHSDVHLNLTLAGQVHNHLVEYTIEITTHC